MDRLSERKLQFAISTLERYKRYESPLGPLFLKPMFIYIFLIFVAYHFGIFGVMSFFKPVSGFLSNYIPVIEYYFIAGKMNAANMYSFFVIGIFFITIKGLLSNRMAFFPLFGTISDKLILLFLRVLSTSYMSLLIFILIGKATVTVQHRCPDIYQTAQRECMNMAATPETASFHHLILMIMAALFWGTAVVWVVRGHAPEFISKKYSHNNKV